MSKLPEHLLATNPLQSEGVYIIRTRYPRLFVKVHEFDDLQKSMEFGKDVNTGSAGEFGGVHHVLELIKLLDEVKSNQSGADLLAKKMRIMSDWLISVKYKRGDKWIT